MGTLFNQRERDSYTVSEEDIDDFLHGIREMAKDHDMQVNQVIEACKVLEMKRRNNLYHWDRDTFDEQMAGLGKLISRFITEFRYHR